MCGRFVGFRNLEQLEQYFPIDTAKCEPVANYNVAPTQEILAIARLDGSNVLDQYHWGLVPFWAKDTAIGYKAQWKHSCGFGSYNLRFHYELEVVSIAL